jgi:hypothetical protein
MMSIVFQKTSSQQSIIKQFELIKKWPLMAIMETIDHKSACRSIGNVSHYAAGTERLFQ